MKRKKIIPLLVVCFILLMTFTTTVNAEEGYTTVNGGNESQMTVTGDLAPRSTEETEEPKEEEEPEKETPKPVVKPTDTAGVKKDGSLPKTGESQSTYRVLGLILVMASLLIISKNRLKRKN